MSSMGGEPDLVFNSYCIAEPHRAKHGALLIFDVDAVMEHDLALVFGRFSERDARLSNGMRSRRGQIRKLNALIIRHIDVIIQMKVEIWHDRRALNGSARSAL